MSAHSERDAEEELKKHLHDPLQPEDEDSQLVVNWVVNLMFLLLAFIATLFDDVQNKIIELQNRPLASAAPATSTAQATTQHTPEKQGKRPRCSKCHARGHVNSDCRTIDPSATRRRVTINAQRKKAAGYPPPSFFSLPLGTQPVPGSSAQTAAYAAPAEYAALAADATELRRRSVQSARDKRRARRAPPKPSEVPTERPRVFVA